MKIIQTHTGEKVFVDDGDYDKLKHFKWYLATTKRRDQSYAVRYSHRINKRTFLILMHREIMRAPRGIDVDHRSRNGLDNRRSNLRLCSRTQNQHNQKLRSTSTSGYKGVSWHRLSRKWEGYITIAGKFIYLGLFVNVRDAAEAYNNAARKYFGKFARLNNLDKGGVE